MTKIVYGNYDDRFYFEASGHAVSDEVLNGCGCDETDISRADSDSVCAAISILVLAAAERLRELDSDGELIHFSDEVESGYACFDVTPRDYSTDSVKEIFELLMSGFSLLEENYPELICCE
ncbi:MAG: ribosomal-processing cysteine protease Prp [Clostridia bacterium]|nr:ribosomal-processing cysteine protease Prp [Clostridia bacterium]